jgi:predicted MFS family arabinose efflux permease
MNAGRYRKYLLGVLLVTLAFNAVDRLALGLLLQDIKTDLALSDTQLGLISGIAFALFYSVMGVPIARWADRGNRVVIISLATALWSAAVALCGLAGSFVQLLLIRVGVAVGEAGCVPAAHSLIADHFSRAERPRAAAVFLLGSPLSALLGYFLAGWLNELVGWRATFVILGLPGIALAALAWFTLKEPRRDHPQPVHPSLGRVCRALWANETFRYVSLCFCVMAFFSFGISKWLPAFFVRSFGLQTGELGTWFTVIFGLGGLAGTYWGGALASRYAAHNERLQLRSIAIALPVIGGLWACVFLSTHPHAAFGWMALASLASAMAGGPIFAAIQTMIAPGMRAMSIALVYLFANLIGMGLGPLATGVLSDAFQATAAAESLRYALLVLCPGYLLGGWALWRASRTITLDLQATNR